MGLLGFYEEAPLSNAVQVTIMKSMMRLDTFLKENAEIKSFERGDMVFKAGDEADAAYYLIEGSVDIVKTVEEDGQDVLTIATLGADDIFGEMSLLRFDHYTMSAKASSAIKVYRITPDLIYSEIRKTHPLVRTILDTLIDRVHAMNKLLLDMERTNRISETQIL